MRSAHRFFVRQYKSTTAVPAVLPRRFVQYDGKDASRCVINELCGVAQGIIGKQSKIAEIFLKNFPKKISKGLDKRKEICYNSQASIKGTRTTQYGGIAQLARALGSYPNGRWFKSDFRYQKGPLVKRLRHGPFTAVTRVRFPHGSP